MSDDIFSQETPDQIKFKKELERSSKDRIRVYNPTEQDFDVYNDGYRWTVPAKNRDNGFGEGQQVFPRYLAVSFVQKLCDKIFMNDMDQAVKKENDRRVEKGLAKLNKWEEQAPFEIEYSQITEENKTKRKEMMMSMWLGIEEEYGADMIKEREQRPRPQSDDDFLKGLSSRRATVKPEIGLELPKASQALPAQQEVSALDELRSKNQFQLRAIAKEKGLETDKSDKKADLIERLTK